jgi:hypothetical protein
VIAVLLASLLVSAQSAATPPTPAPAPSTTTTTKPSKQRALQEATAIANAVQALLPALHKEERSIPCAGLDALKTLYVDVRGGAPNGAPSGTVGIVRRYEQAFGSGDSMYTVTASYDERGRLRLLHVQGGAVSNSTSTLRVAYDDLGRELARDVKNTGPGWTWYRPKDAHVPRDARAAYGLEVCPFDEPDEPDEPEPLEAQKPTKPTKPQEPAPAPTTPPATP